MAEKDATVELAEEGIVTVDVSDNPDLANADKETASEEATKEAAELEAKPEKKNVRLKEAESKLNAVEEATAALSQQVKVAEDARKAAEATAQNERRRAEEAARQAAQHEAAARQAQQQVESGEVALLNTGIENATRELSTYQDELQRALEAGEFQKVAEVQVKMSKAAATLGQLEASKSYYEANSRRAPTTEGRVEATQQQEVPPFERYVAGFAPVAQTWLRQHPECVPAQLGGDARKNAAMMKGHFAALEQSIPEGTPEYFRVIEEMVGYRAPVSATANTTAADDEAEDAAPKSKQKKALPSAPVSREPPNAQGQVSRTTRSVTLTKEQQDAAKMSWPNLAPQQAFANYARNLLELEAEGKMGRLTH